MAELIQVEHRERVVSITLNRPERRNALSFPLLTALGEALSNGISDDTTAVVLTGAGNCFSAGADFTDLKGTLDDLAMDDAIEAVTSSIRGLPVPVIAAINGPCLGGAFDLAATCDVRIASVNAIFQVPATRMGILYNPKSVARMRLLFGRDIVFRLMIIGERLDAEAALGAGIVSQVVAEGEGLNAALAMAQGTEANLPAAVAATKAFLNAFDSDDYEPRHWQKVREELLSSPDRLEAVSHARARHGRS